MNKLYKKLIESLSKKSLIDANKDMKAVYTKHRSDRDKILKEISSILLNETIEDNRVVMKAISKKEFLFALDNTISDIIVDEAITEKEIIEKVLVSAAIDKYNINSYVTSIGKDFKLKKLTSKQIATIVNQEVQGEVWDDRIWTNKRVLEKKLRKDLRNLLDGNTDINKIKEEIELKFNQNAYNSSRLVNNELARVQYEVNDEFARENQMTKQMFVATLDDRTSEECESYDGQIFDIDDSSKPDIPVHVNCRCTYVNIVDDWTPTKRKDNITKEVGNWSSYKKWLSDQ